MIKEAIVKIVNKEDLTYDEAYTVMNEIMSGETTATQNAAFLAALSTKSARAETTDEIAGCAAAMRTHAIKVETGNSRRLRELIPAEALFVSESGVKSAEDVRKLREIGADAVLIGETLMRAADKKAKLAELRGQT